MPTASRHRPRRRVRCAALLLGALLSPTLLRARPPESEAGPDWAALALERLPALEICERPNAPEPLLCGTIEVPEDPERAGGRRIGLSVVVVPAHSESPPADPVVIFEGGPGGAATGRAAYATYTGPVRARDILLVDQRGTGASHSLDCDLDVGGLPGELEAIFPPEAVARCAETLSADADLSLYGSAEHADDIEVVRRTLGYGKLNLRGGSYGSRAMMVYAQRYPGNVRTMFGIGVDSPMRSNLAERGLHAERVLRALGDLCAADADCARLVPDLYATTARLLASLEEAPRRLTIDDPTRPGEKLSLEVGHGWLAEQIRLLLYYVFTSRALPWAVHRAVRDDDLQPLAELAVVIERFFRSSLSEGVLFTVQCSEGMDFDHDAALARGRSTLFGNYRLEQQIGACAVWPHEVRPPLGIDEPKPLGIPTLLLSGALDPVTPPEYAEGSRDLFPNSLHVVLDEGHHGPFDLEGSFECIHRLWADLLEHGSVDGLDTTCADEMRRPPFLMDEVSFHQHLAETLVPLAG